MKTFTSIADLLAFKGQEAGPGPWHTVTQDTVNLFAQATGDHQWIHTDPERARRESPFGGPVAHGFFTLSLLPALSAEISQFEGVKARVNYGLNRVRFTGPVPVGARVRMRSTLVAADEEPGDSIKVLWSATFEVEGNTKPVCVAETLAKLYF